MQAVIGDDAANGTKADGEVCLPELLHHDLRRSVGIQEDVTQDLPHHLFGAAMVGFGSGFLGLEGGKAAVLESPQQLIIPLAAVAVFFGDGDRVDLEALAFEEHEETVGRGIVWGDGQGAGRAGELMRGGVELKSGLHGGKIREGEGIVYLIMAH